MHSAKRKLHTCEVCGKEEHWRKGWCHVMAISDITGQFPVKFCSDSCCEYWHEGHGQVALDEGKA